MSRWTENKAAMCQEKISAARVGGREVDGRSPRCISQVAWRMEYIVWFIILPLNTWSIVKKVLQNLTSLFSKMTSRIEERAQERMTKSRRTR